MRESGTVVPLLRIAASPLGGLGGGAPGTKAAPNTCRCRYGGESATMSCRAAPPEKRGRGRVRKPISGAQRGPCGNRPPRLCVWSGPKGSRDRGINLLQTGHWCLGRQVGNPGSRTVAHCIGFFRIVSGIVISFGVGTRRCLFGAKSPFIVLSCGWAPCPPSVRAKTLHTPSARRTTSYKGHTLVSAHTSLAQRPQCGHAESDLPCACDTLFRPRRTVPPPPTTWAVTIAAPQCVAWPAAAVHRSVLEVLTLIRLQFAVPFCTTRFTGSLAHAVVPARGPNGAILFFSRMSAGMHARTHLTHLPQPPPTHSVTHSLSHSPTHPPTHPRTHSPTHYSLLIDSLLLTHSPTHSLP